MLDKYVPSWKSTGKVRDHPQSELYSKLCKPTTELQRSKAASLPYMNIVGALLFVAVMTRPDIAYNTSMLAKFMSDPSVEAHDLAINLLLYLAHNPTLEGCQPCNKACYTPPLDVRFTTQM